MVMEMPVDIHKTKQENPFEEMGSEWNLIAYHHLFYCRADRLVTLE